MNVKNELGKLLFCFDRGKITYREYLENGCTYMYARILKDNNTAIKLILMAIYHELPKQQQDSIMQLMHHIDVWSSLWECLEAELSPNHHDRFVFENSVTYPANAQENLMNYYETIK